MTITKQCCLKKSLLLNTIDREIICQREKLVSPEAIYLAWETLIVLFLEHERFMSLCLKMRRWCTSFYFLLQDRLEHMGNSLQHTCLREKNDVISNTALGSSLLPIIYAFNTGIILDNLKCDKMYCLPATLRPQISINICWKADVPQNWYNFCSLQDMLPIL